MGFGSESGDSGFGAGDYGGVGSGGMGPSDSGGFGGGASTGDPALDSAIDAALAEAFSGLLGPHTTGQRSINNLSFNYPGFQALPSAFQMDRGMFSKTKGRYPGHLANNMPASPYSNARTMAEAISDITGKYGQYGSLQERANDLIDQAVNEGLDVSGFTKGLSAVGPIAAKATKSVFAPSLATQGIFGMLGQKAINTVVDKALAEATFSNIADDLGVPTQVGKTSAPLSGKMDATGSDFVGQLLATSNRLNSRKAGEAREILRRLGVNV